MQRLWPLATLLLALFVVSPAAASHSSEPRSSPKVTHGTQLSAQMTGLPDGWEGDGSGKITSSYDGQVIENLDIRVSEGAGVVVEHDDVTVRNNRIRHGGGANGVYVTSSADGVKVVSNHLDGREEVIGNRGSVGVYAAGQAEVRRNFITGGRVGVHFDGGNSKAVENWVDALTVENGSHGAGFSFHGDSSEGGIEFARNRTVASNSGGITLYASAGPVVDVAVHDNLVVGVGDGFGIYGGRTHGYYRENREVSIEGNRFSGEFGWSAAAGRGATTAVDTQRPGNSFADNRWTGSEEEVPARCGISGNECE